MHLVQADIYEDDAGGEYTRHVLADPAEVRVRVRVRVRGRGRVRQP